GEWLPRAGVQPTRVGAEQGEDDRRVLETEMARDYGSACDRDVRVLEKLWRIQQCRFVADPDRGVPAADHLFCGRTRLTRQFVARAAMALARRAAAGRREKRPRYHVRHFRADARAVSEERRQVPRSATQAELAIRTPR